jgi:hypothetical protein
MARSKSKHKIKRHRRTVKWKKRVKRRKAEKKAGSQS